MPRTPTILMLFSASHCFCRVVGAQVPDPTALNTPETPVSRVPLAPENSVGERVVTEIVLVGNIENAARLANELGQLLSAQGFAPRFQQRVVLSQNELIAQQQPNDPSRGTVWILAPNSTSVRLVFADRAHTRFLIRDVPLQQGMDDVGRESVEQIIESSFLALLQGAGAMGRAEVHAALGADVVSVPMTAPQEPTQPNVPLAALPGPWVQAQPNQPATDSADGVPSSRQLTQRLGIGYGMGWAGGDSGLEHGPELLLGLEVKRHNDSFTIAGAFGLHFAQHHRTSEFDLSLQNSTIFALAGWRKPIRTPTSFVVAIGPGVGVTRVRASAYPGVSAASYPDSSSVFPAARLQSGLEWGDSPFAIQLALRADVSFYDTHFEISRNGDKETLSHPWLLRPGVALGAVWR